jgi:hypothetical protein
MGRREVHTGFWWGNLKETDHVAEPGVHGRIILREVFQKWEVRVKAGSSWLRIGTVGRHM